MSQETVRLTREMFEQLQQVLKVSVPEDIIVHYTSKPCVRNDFTRTVFEASTHGYVPELVVQITPEFAKQIADTFTHLKAEEKLQLEEEIKNVDAENFNWFTNTLSYLLIDGVRKYNVETNTFAISVIDAAYIKLLSNIDLMRLILKTWEHCGGWGGVVLRGEKTGYDGGGSHDRFAGIEYNGETYEYSSNFFGSIEKHHLDKK
jgi:hypothetical protein